jgi:hypothetical protein
VLTEEKLGEVGARLEHTPQKSLGRLAQETGISISSAAKAMKLLTFRPYKTGFPALQPRGPANRINFCNWFLQSVHDGEVGSHVTIFFYGVVSFAWMFPHKVIGTKVLVIHAVPLHCTKVGLWCAMNAKRIIGPIFYAETTESPNMKKPQLHNSEFFKRFFFHLLLVIRAIAVRRHFHLLSIVIRYKERNL